MWQSQKPCRNNKESVPAAYSPGNTAVNQCPSSAFERHQLAFERERESIQVKLVCNNFGALQPVLSKL